MAVTRLQDELKLSGLESVRMLVVGGEIILEGSVSSYAEKRDLETRLSALKVTIRNCLRIVPG